VKGVTAGDLTTARRLAEITGVSSDAGLDLLAARVSARRRGRRWASAVTIASLLLFAAWSISNRENDVDGLTQITALYALIIPAVLLGFSRQAALDRQMAAGLRVRVAGSERHGILAVVARPYLIATAICYGGALAVALWSLWGTPTREGREAAITVVAGVLVLAVLTFAVLISIVRRPAVAIDEQTLRADALMRREDATDALAPYPILVALVVAAGGYVPGFDRYFLAYAVATGMLYLWAGREHRKTIDQDLAR
jgi:hypothetical protein